MRKKKRQELIKMLADEIDVLDASETVADKSKKKVDVNLLAYQLGVVDGFALALLHAEVIDHKTLSEVTRRSRQVMITHNLLG